MTQAGDFGSVSRADSAGRLVMRRGPVLSLSPPNRHERLRAMRMEVHVHGNVFLGRGVRLSQIEHALKPWLEYLDVDTLAEAVSVERE